MFLCMKNYLYNKNIAIFGLGLSGVASIQYALANNATVFAWDDKNHSIKSQISDNNFHFLPPSEYDWGNIDYLILSPGVPLTHPKPADIVVMAQKHDVPIICDIEVLYNDNKDCSYIAITGTNGKSTTTALIGHILQDNNVESKVGGNIGVAALQMPALSTDGAYVIEMSSYQLDLIDNFAPTVSVLLNITPDHIDRHGDLNGYITAKKNIYNNQGLNDYAVISIDNLYTKEIYGELKAAGQIGKVIPISTNEVTSNGISIIDGVLHDNLSESSSQVKLGELKKLTGKHNAENIAAAIAAILATGKVSLAEIINSVKSFAGLAHRMQHICDKGNIAFVNDSKATNAEAAEKSLGSFKNIYWIAGGVAKEGGITPLAPLLPNVKEVFLIGRSQDEFAEFLDGKVPYKKCNTLDKATEAAYAAASQDTGKSVILLAPACASFDQWKNFEKRGEAFCEVVGSL